MTPTTRQSADPPGAGAQHRPRVAVIVPAFNEEASIAETLTGLGEIQHQHAEWEWRTIVINDGSTDSTLSTIKGVQLPLTVLDLPVNLGIGAAVQTGFIYALRWGADVALQLDGDGQHPAAAIPELVGPVLSGNADVAVGSRYLAGAGGGVSHALRRLGTWLFSHLLKLLVRVEIKDVTSGFRAFNRDALRFSNEHYADDYPEVEAYVPLARRGYRIVEVPVVMKQREGGRSSISAIRSTYYMFKVTLAVMIQLIKPLHQKGDGKADAPRGGAPDREP